MKLSVDGAQEAESQVRWYNGGSGSLTVDIRYNAGDYEYLQLSAKVGGYASSYTHSQLKYCRPAATMAKFENRDAGCL
jgi:hypothetical protein